MPSYFTETRNVELSTLEYLETQLGTDWTNVTLEKTFKRVYSKDVSLPIVCVRLADTNNLRKEVGSTAFDNRHIIIVDLFTTSDGMRIDLADYIADKLKDGWDYKAYSHVSGDNSQITGVADGKIFVTEFIANGKIDFGENVDVKDRFRHTISVIVRKST